eukprot:TRINITY_DN4401_c0_g1_i2.p1 TRINITY_DN4401_c0_g1~~TRINITY_DN4401_c0_g1_i2.p1  ORF type:complete len:864 (-),score=172.49 TRINITY_DN4401_c0_g1_i2:333-2924(-)
MAVFDFFANMEDSRLKPRLLKSLITDRLPTNENEKEPFTAPYELAAVVSTIKTHSLLSESLPEPCDPKLVETWKSAVDAWIEHLLSLISSKMPDKCWAGICLLGVTCQECSLDRFLASYSVWFQKLFAQIQLPSDSHFVKIASCASLSDLFTRLGGFSTVKKDGTSQASQLIQPILKLLTEEVSETMWEGAVDLLCTLMTFFPSSVHRYYDNAEAVIVSKILSGKYNSGMSKKFAEVLALLPKARGDEDSWTLLMQKILISINMHLNDAFQGLEEETKSTEVVRLLVPPGKDPPPPLGGQSVLEEVSAQATKWFDQWLMLRVSTLMQCCCIMLTSPYTVQVTVPVRLLLALVGRVLSVDGSLGQALQPFMTVMQQELICSELPVLHLGSLDILIAVIKGVRSQLLPHVADVVRLLKEYFGRCTLPSLRIRVYSIMQVLLISMGVGIALYVAEAIIANAFADLNFISQGSGLAYSNAYSSIVMSQPLKQPSNKKRKLASGSPAEQQNVVEVDNPNNKRTTPLSVQIAALQALEALLTVGGAVRSEGWRSDVDLLLITVATHACNGGWSNKEKNCILSEESTSTRADFQLAALRALLASLLSPTCVRPRYLSRGLELFRLGRQETGTRLAEFCAHALLALEVLIHPRALPLSDFSSGNRSMVDEGFNHRFPFPSSQSPNIHFPRGMPSTADDLDPEDELYDSWLGNGEEGATHIGDEQNKNSNEESLMNEMVPDVKVPYVANCSGDASSGDPVPPVEQAQGPIGSPFVELVGSRDKNMAESEQLNVSASGVGISSGVTLLPSDSAANMMPSEKDVNSADPTDFRKCPLVSGGVSPSTGKGKGLTLSSDSDLDSLPDIVDGDPDSD